jgi:hypothetical protein
MHTHAKISLDRHYPCRARRAKSREAALSQSAHFALRLRSLMQGECLALFFSLQVALHRRGSIPKK